VAGNATRAGKASRNWRHTMMPTITTIAILLVFVGIPLAIYTASIAD
jgi:hypothetical protein